MKLRINESNNSVLIKKLNKLDIGYGHSETTYELTKQYEVILKDFDINTVISFKTDAGTDTFIKVSNDYIGWQALISPHYDLKDKSTYDVASWLASRGNMMRGPIKLGTDIDIEKEAEKAYKYSISNRPRFNFIK